MIDMRLLSQNRLTHQSRRHALVSQRVDNQLAEFAAVHGYTGGTGGVAFTTSPLVSLARLPEPAAPGATHRPAPSFASS